MVLVKYKGSLHRGLILNLDDSSNVKLRLIESLRDISVPKENIHRIRKMHATTCFSQLCRVASNEKNLKIETGLIQANVESGDCDLPIISINE